MEAIILGTAAAEGIPALFCGCKACRKARETDGREIRARQSLFLPPDILVDLGADCLYSVHRFSLDWSGLAAILYTHSHDDHCYPQQLGYVKPVFANDRTTPNITLYGNPTVREKIRAIAGEPADVEMRPAPLFQPIALPNATAIPIHSHHKQDGEETLNYILSRGGKTFLYACDMGSYDEETWEFLKTVRLDSLVIECTFGPKARDPKWPFHLGLPDAAAVRDRLREQGTLRPEAPCVLTHFSHNGIVPYDEFQALAEPLGFQVAYDGMNVPMA